MSYKPVISIVLGSFNRKTFLKFTIDSIRKEIKRCGVLTEIIVVDGGSTDGSIKWLTKQKDIITIIQHNRGKWKGKNIERKSWGYFMNLAFKTAKGKYVCMVSDDCILIPGALKNTYTVFEEKLKKDQKIGGAAFYWRNYPVDKEYIVGLTLGGKLFINHGFYLNEVLKKVDYIDEDTCFFYHGDGDLSLKIWHAGYEIIDSPDAYIEHFVHANEKIRESNYTRQKKDWENYLNKWKGIYSHDEEIKSGGKLTRKYYDFTYSGSRFLFFYYFNMNVVFFKIKMILIFFLKKLNINYKFFRKN